MIFNATYRNGLWESRKIKSRQCDYAGANDSPTKTQSEVVQPSMQGPKTPTAPTRRTQEAATPQNRGTEKALKAFQALRQLHTLWKVCKAFPNKGSDAQEMVQAANSANNLLIQ